MESSDFTSSLSDIDTSSLTGEAGKDALGVIGDITVGVLKIVAASLVGS